MKKFFKKFLLNKGLLILIFGVLLLLYYIFNPLLYVETDYMIQSKISDLNYIYYIYMLPMSFSELDFVLAISLEMVYLSLLVFSISKLCNFFFGDTASTSILRVNKKKFISKLFIVNAIISVVICALYFIFYLVLCYFNKVDFTFSINNLYPILYKLLLSLIIPNLYLLIYIYTDKISISLFSIFLANIVLELVIKSTFLTESSVFTESSLLITFFVTAYFLLYFSIKKIFLRRDLS